LEIIRRERESAPGVCPRRTAGRASSSELARVLYVCVCQHASSSTRETATKATTKRIPPRCARSPCASEASSPLLFSVAVAACACAGNHSRPLGAARRCRSSPAE
jgi:hypothetical protein